MLIQPTTKGRGTPLNSPKRFQPIAFKMDGDFADAEYELPEPQT